MTLSHWDPTADRFDASPLEGVDAVVHLAGESIAADVGRRPKKSASATAASTVRACSAEALAAMRNPPRVFVGASAIGFYGDRGDELLDEESAAGDSFLADVCTDWEAASGPAADAGIRVALVAVRRRAQPQRAARWLRCSLPFKLGAGGRVGRRSAVLELGCDRRRCRRPAPCD